MAKKMNKFFVLFSLFTLMTALIFTVTAKLAPVEVSAVSLDSPVSEIDLNTETADTQSSIELSSIEEEASEAPFEVSSEESFDLNVEEDVEPQGSESETTSSTTLEKFVYQDWGDQFLTHAELQDEDGNPQDEFGVFDNMLAHWEFVIPSGTELSSGDTMTFKIPDALTMQTIISFDVTDSAGNVIGHAVADSSTGEIVITFTDYAEQAAKNGVTGEFDIWVNWDRTQIEEDTLVTMDWGKGGTTEVTVTPGNDTPDSDEKLYKWGYVDPNDPTIIHWTVRVNFEEATIYNAVYKDTLDSKQELISGSITAYYVSGWNSDWTPILGEPLPTNMITEIDTNNFQVDFAELNRCVYIYYDSRTIDDGQSSTYNNYGELTGDNIVTEIVDVNTANNGGSGSASSKVTISGSKTWVDNEDSEGLRPNEIILHLYRNGEKIDSTTVTAEDNWQYTFKNLDRYDSEANEYSYSVEEEKVDNYEPTQDGYNFTNTLTGTQTISGEKTWDDQNDQDGLRPESITVNLLADGEVVDSMTVTSEDNWAYSFTDLPKYQNGKEIVYTITENFIPDYSTKIDGYNLKNTYTPAKTSVTVTKRWEDNENQDEQRPDNIIVQLYANDEKHGEEVLLDDSNNWTMTWTDLPEKDNGETILYSVEEVSDVPYYTSSVDDSDLGNIIITNLYTPTPDDPEEDSEENPEEDPKEDPEEDPEENPEESPKDYPKENVVIENNVLDNQVTKTEQSTMEVSTDYLTNSTVNVDEQENDTPATHSGVLPKTGENGALARYLSVMGLVMLYCVFSFVVKKINRRIQNNKQEK